jgi:hypothetical protein
VGVVVAAIAVLLGLLLKVVHDPTEAGRVAVVVRHDDGRIQALKSSRIGEDEDLILCSSHFLIK